MTRTTLVADPVPDFAEVAERLMYTRRSLRWTQTQLSQASGVLPSTISKVERGINRYWSDALFRLATAMGLSLDLLCLSDRATFEQVVQEAMAQREESDS